MTQNPDNNYEESHIIYILSISNYGMPPNYRKVDKGGKVVHYDVILDDRKYVAQF